MNRVLRIMILALVVQGAAPGQERTLDSFETLQHWKAFSSDGVEVSVRPVDGVRGRALALKYRFNGGGYCGVTRDVRMPLPENYTFSYSIKGEGPANTLEVKFSDTTGENVWWKTQRDFQPPPSWERMRVKKRQITFAWGPDPSPDLSYLGRIEFVVSAGEGGSGEIVIDELVFEELERVPAVYPAPRVSASAEPGGTRVSDVIDGNPETAWESPNAEGGDWIQWDFGSLREFGGLELSWDEHRHPPSYAVLGSRDGRTYDTLYAARNSRGGKRIVPLPEAEARSVRLLIPKGQKSVRLHEARILPLEATLTPNNLFSMIARGRTRGLFPKYLLDEASYWNVIGVPGDPSEGLINTDAAIEVDKSRFSLEPFLFLNGHLYTWNDVSATQRLADGELPIPLVLWTGPGFRLETTAFACGSPGSSELRVRYVLTCTGPQHLRGRFFIAIRPFQVNPAYQWLNTRGGVASIRHISWKEGLLDVDEKTALAQPAPDVFGAAGFDEGDITEYLAAGMVPLSESTTDPHGFASGALGYDLDLGVGDSLAVSIVVPFHENAGPSLAADQSSQLHVAEAQQFWRTKLSSVQVHLPGASSKLVKTLRSNLAYILINMDGPAIQPGSRSYERSWIRDGSLTSAALLRMGFSSEVRLFLEWYSRFQYPDGKIPCVVDRRGADPVAEHDSHGQYVFALMQYYRFTQDTAFLRAHWPAVQKAVDYIQTLRGPRLTDKFASGSDSLRAFYGLVTESISHEGYSSKPMHSYWDNLFVLRGMKDAALMAHILGERERQAEYDSLSKTFRSVLIESIRRTMKHHNIDYVPGCVELGDFDATSTTIALYPVDEQRSLPGEALRSTFDRYYNFAMERAAGNTPWTAYTPYEIRTAGSFVLLGEKERAHAMLDWFLSCQRPKGWNHWAEVVWSDPSRAAFIGDMPHTWVGSDFVNALRIMLVYEREEDSTLVVGAGIRESWLTEGDSVCADGLRTYFGAFGYTMTRQGDSVRVTLKPGKGFCAKGILLPSPLDRPLTAVLVDGRPQAVVPPEVVRVAASAQVVTFIYR